MRLPAAARPNCKFNVDADTAHRFGYALWAPLNLGVRLSMQHSTGYATAPEYMRSRSEVSYDSLRVVIESYPSKDLLSDVSHVFLSTDGGHTFYELNWKVAPFTRALFMVTARDWPPKSSVTISGINSSGFTAKYLENTDETHSKLRKVQYDLRTGIWSTSK